MLLAGCAPPDAHDRGTLHTSSALQHAEADLVARTRSGEEGAAADHRVIIVADGRRHAVVARGTPEDPARIERRIRGLDVR